MKKRIIKKTFKTAKLNKKGLLKIRKEWFKWKFFKRMET